MEGPQNDVCYAGKVYNTLFNAFIITVILKTDCLIIVWDYTVKETAPFEITNIFNRLQMKRYKIKTYRYI